MCGIAGIIHSERHDANAERAELAQMLQRLRHRGPDDQGCWSEGPVHAGHRRLSIVDLSPAGHQPMLSASGRYVIALNGEIYNHIELKEQLLARGCRFKGHSDTEVLLSLIDEQGLEGALRLVTGMFALAVWDRRERRLALARDRFGEKPLYYGWHGGRFLWASELKALEAHGSFDRTLDEEAVAELLRFGYVRSPRSIYRHVRKVDPGSIVRLTVPEEAEAISLSGCRVEHSRYWSADEIADAARIAPHPAAFEEAVDRLDALLLDAVSKQMRADVPLGAFLSGGVDSSVVVAQMCRASGRPVHTFSIGFDDPALDESPHARAVARHLGTIHSEERVTERDALDVVPMLPQMYCEPMADSSQIPTYLVCRMARRQVTVALSGDGGDELFGGYAKYARGLTWNRWRGPWSSVAARLLPDIARGVRGIAPGLAHALRPSRIALARGLLGASSQFELALSFSTVDFEPPLRKPLPWQFANACASTRDRASDYLRTAMDLDRQSYLPDDVLTKVDRASMAVSLEARAPLLDHHVHEFVRTLPSEFLWDGRRGKRILREVLYRHVPRALVDRPKAGFVVPMAGWLRGALKPWAQDLLAAPPPALAEILEFGRLRALLDQHCDPRKPIDASPRLWAALTLVAWHAARAR